MKEPFGEYIRKLRVENGLTLTQLAAYIGIDSGALSKIENGKKKLDEKVLSRIAEKFNLDLETLKNEFISEQIANKIYECNCSNEVLQLAEQKVNYIKKRNAKQINLTF